jgi:hypothetical protein
MVVFVVYVHQDIQEFDVKFGMHAKVILAWTVVHASLLTAMVVINVYVPLVLVVHNVKLVGIMHDSMLLAVDIVWIML